jgi:hypothetical protein
VTAQRGDFDAPLTNEQRATEITGCRPWGGAGSYCAHQRFDVGCVPWHQCRWVPVAAALDAAEARGRVELEARIEVLIRDADRFPPPDARHRISVGNLRALLEGPT